MKINSKYMAIILILIIFGGIAASSALGLWASESTKIPIKYQTGEFTGEYDPQDIRGSYKFNDISTLFEIDLSILYEAFDINSSTNGDEFKSKDIEAMFEDQEVEIGNASMQLFVALYKRLPLVYDDIYLPRSALKVLSRDIPDLTQDELSYLESHTTGTNSTNNSVIPIASEGENSIKGTTTFQQVLDLGITKAQIEEIINDDMPPSNLKVKDYCLDKGLSFSEIKLALAALIE